MAVQRAVVMNHIVLLTCFSWSSFLPGPVSVDVGRVRRLLSCPVVGGSKKVVTSHQELVLHLKIDN